MFNGRTLTACVAVGAIFAGAGVGQEQQSGETTSPTPRTLPRSVLSANESRQALVAYERDVAVRRAAAKKTEHESNRGERMVVIQALCVQVPANFCERVGLTADAAQTTSCVPVGTSWTLTTRETRMLIALLNGEPEMEVHSRPTLIVRDGQTAYMNVGQGVEVVTGLEAVSSGGSTVYKPRFTKMGGNTLQVTPKFAADDKSVLLAVAAERATLAGTPAQLPIFHSGQVANDEPQGIRPVAFLQCMGQIAVNVQNNRTVASVPVGGTALVGGIVTKATGKKAVETLWLLTVHRERCEEQAIPSGGL